MDTTFFTGLAGEESIEALVRDSRDTSKLFQGWGRVPNNYLGGGGGWLGTPKIKVLSILSCVYIVLTYFV